MGIRPRLAREVRGCIYHFKRSNLLPFPPASTMTLSLHFSDPSSSLQLSSELLAVGFVFESLSIDMPPVCLPACISLCPCPSAYPSVCLCLRACLCLCPCACVQDSAQGLYTCPPVSPFAPSHLPVQFLSLRLCRLRRCLQGSAQWCGRSGREGCKSEFYFVLVSVFVSVIRTSWDCSSSYTFFVFVPKSWC